jgi:hypothetical protein
MGVIAHFKGSRMNTPIWNRLQQALAERLPPQPRTDEDRTDDEDAINALFSQQKPTKETSE